MEFSILQKLITHLAESNEPSYLSPKHKESSEKTSNGDSLAITRTQNCKSIHIP
jgi:hypothetical protein